MNKFRLFFCAVVAFVAFSLSIAADSAVEDNHLVKNQITEDERRAAHVEDAAKQSANFKTRSESKKRSLFSIGSSGGGYKPSYSSSGYGSSGIGSSGGGYYGFSSGGSGPSGHYNPSYSPSYGIPYGAPTGHGFGHSGGGIYSGGHSGGHSGGGGGAYNALAIKKLLIPLAGIALLGAAAALSTNPVLLQLGVVNGKKRRRRSVAIHQQEQEFNKYRQRNVYPANPIVRPHHLKL